MMRESARAYQGEQRRIGPAGAARCNPSRPGARRPGFVDRSTKSLIAKLDELGRYATSRLVLLVAITTAIQVAGADTLQTGGSGHVRCNARALLTGGLVVANLKCGIVYPAG